MSDDLLGTIMTASVRFGHLSADNMFGIGYEAVKPEDIPNFLDESWAIKEEESTDGEE